MKALESRYYAKKTGLLWGTLAFALFATLGWWLFLSDSPRNSVFDQFIIFILVILPSTALVAIGIGVLVKRSPAITMDQHGLNWNVSILTSGSLRWDEIVGVTCINIYGVWFVNLEVTDPASFISRHPWWRRLFFKFLSYIKWPIQPTHIPSSGIKNTTASKLKAEILRWRKFDT